MVETLSVSSYSSKYGLFVWTTDHTAASGHMCVVVAWESRQKTELVVGQRSRVMKIKRAEM